MNKLIEWGQVDCPTHGYQGITEEQYDQEMMDPDNGWHCPICGHLAEWIDQDDMEDAYELSDPPF